MHSDLAFPVLTANASGTFSWSVSASKGLRSWGGTAANTSVASSTGTWNLLLISLSVNCEYAMARTPTGAHAASQCHRGGVRTPGPGAGEYPGLDPGVLQRSSPPLRQSPAG